MVQAPGEADPIDTALGKALDRWRSDRDLRTTRRDLLRLLTELDVDES